MMTLGEVSKNIDKFAPEFILKLDGLFEIIKSRFEYRAVLIETAKRKERTYDERKTAEKP